ncbi:hypothetical protein MAR_003896, partial [Mya arenaria]
MAPCGESYIHLERTVHDDGIKTVGACLAKNAAELGEGDALVFVTPGAQYERNVVTWRQLHENSFNVTRALLKLGLRKGECVAIDLRSCPEWVYLTFGCMVAGLRPACLSFTYTDGSDVVATMERLQTCALLVMDPGENGEKWDVLEQLFDSHSNDASAKSS